MRATERKVGKNATEYQNEINIKQENEYVRIMEEGIRAGSFTPRTTSRAQLSNTQKVKDTMPQAKGRNRPKNKRDEAKSALEQSVETGL